VANYQYLEPRRIGGSQSEKHSISFYGGREFILRYSAY